MNPFYDKTQHKMNLSNQPLPPVQQKSGKAYSSETQASTTTTPSKNT